MYIVSKYKDYYDNIAGITGIDKTNVYVRKQKTIGYTRDELIYQKLRHIRTYLDSMSESDLQNINRTKEYLAVYSSFLVGFCGNLYIGYIFQYNIDEYLKNNVVQKSKRIQISYNQLQIIDILNKHGWSFNEKLLKYTFDTVHALNITDIHLHYNTPVFIIDREYQLIDDIDVNSNAIINPLLKTYKFQKVVNARTAFQEIEMFLPRFRIETISEMTNEQKIHSHGLDETSFRCEAPGNKKSRRKVNKERKRNKND